MHGDWLSLQLKLEIAAVLALHTNKWLGCVRTLPDGGVSRTAHSTSKGYISASSRRSNGMAVRNDDRPGIWILGSIALFFSCALPEWACIEEVALHH